MPGYATRSSFPGQPETLLSPSSNASRVKEIAFGTYWHQAMLEVGADFCIALSLPDFLHTIGDKIADGHLWKQMARYGIAAWVDNEAAAKCEAASLVLSRFAAAVEKLSQFMGFNARIVTNLYTPLRAIDSLLGRRECPAMVLVYVRSIGMPARASRP